MSWSRAAFGPAWTGMRSALDGATAVAPAWPAAGVAAGSLRAGRRQRAAIYSTTYVLRMVQHILQYSTVLHTT